MDSRDLKQLDRVRIVIEDQVVSYLTVLGPSEILVTGAGHRIALNDDRLSVEKITPPLPTTPGSVIHYGNNLRRLTRKGNWRLISGPSMLRDLPLDPDYTKDYKVIFDAGAK